MTSMFIRNKAKKRAPRRRRANVREWMAWAFWWPGTEQSACSAIWEGCSWVPCILAWCARVGVLALTVHMAIKFIV